MRVGDAGRVLAVRLVRAELRVPGRVGRSAIDKRPVTGRVAARRLGLDRDHVCDTEHHGGAHRAVYGCTEEDAAICASDIAASVPETAG